MEQKIKSILGDLMFNMISLQAQVEQLQQEVNKLNDEDKSKRKKSD